MSYIKSSTQKHQFYLKSIVILIAMLLVLGSFSLKPVYAQSNGFSDLKPDDMGYDDVMALVDAGIISGYKNGTFKPYDNISREHVAVMLAEALNLPTPSNVADILSDYKDVNEKYLYAEQIAAVTKAGVFKGSNGYFKPSADITRSQMATVLVTAFTLKGNDNPVDFTDLDKIGSSHRKNVEILAQNNITQGKQASNGKRYFDGDDQLKRVQFAIFLQLSMQKGTPVEPGEDSKQYVTTKYDIDFLKMLDKQMAVNPQTDSNGTWYNAGRELVEYYTNPNNFSKDSNAYYQFLLLSKNAGLSAKDINDKILAGKGILKNKGSAFIEASKKHNINEVYLIAHALLESGNGGSTLANGIKVGLDKSGNPQQVTSANKNSLTAIKTTYNMFGIGANDGNAEKLGSERAYKEKWFTPEAAIIGGAAFIGNEYLSIGQDTLYKMRWNPAGLVNKGYANHQYATDAGWAVKQTRQMEKTIELYNLLDTYVMVFDVPSFKNEPASIKRPNGDAEYAVNTSSGGLIGTTTADLNLRKAPSTAYDVIVTLPRGTKVEIIGENTGWYKVKASGKQGWVSGSYLKFENQLQVVNIASGSSLNVRNTPNGTVVGSLKNGAIVTGVTNSSGSFVKKDGWYKIIYSGKEAWVSGDFIKEK